MLIIEVADADSIEKALKKYKKKFERTATMKQLRSRQTFIKPSIVRRSTILKAVYRGKMVAALESED